MIWVSKKEGSYWWLWIFTEYILEGWVKLEKTNEYVEIPYMIYGSMSFLLGGELFSILSYIYIYIYIYITPSPLDEQVSYTEPLDKQWKTRRYIKIQFIFFSSTPTFVWSRSTVRESSHIFLLWQAFFLWSSAMAEEYTQGSWQVCLSEQQISGFSTKLQTIYGLSRPMYFLFMAGYRNLHTSVFFPLIC